MAFQFLTGSFFFVLFIQFFSFFTIFLLFQEFFTLLWLVRKNFLKNIKYLNSRLRILLFLRVVKHNFEKEFVLQKLAKAYQI